ncbi:hypothetical protein J2847_004088 [Azospirillum agricola]|uniref:hypothetical protein n=1 Tax=Azospirillum agricola TaxID=1720247 RepID=UPI001AEB2D7F|nr:hypothetical protein [Azospirillum agricola]MBP2230779.1 hypothetical protein [Azospirillum agricola]
MATKNPRKNVALPTWLVARIETLAVHWGTSESNVMRMLIEQGVKSVDTAETLLDRLRDEGFSAAAGTLAGHPLIAETVLSKGLVRATLTDGRRLVFPRDGVPTLEQRAAAQEAT